ncbi:hypothetical protein Nepgr_015876 [Nepenthes gracilis]|uniref:Uncharacterized protein n=1 Tax=Nepenthes gracilis TaxID=150966 RepID=A0AAD3SNM1_NEPGR|nr:hypothetical protein Nepgr_015876 [Nepenthes gracilis]
MYKATGRILPLPPSLPSRTTKKPKSPQEHVKENTAAISTSNSFEILHDEDGSSNLVNLRDIPQSMDNQLSLAAQITPIEKPSDVVVMDGLESHDTSVSSDLDVPLTCTNADTDLVHYSRTSGCSENMVLNSDPQGTSSECPSSH